LIDRITIIRGYIEILIPLANIDRDHMIVRLDKRLDLLVIHQAPQRMAVRAPVGAEVQKYVLLILLGLRERGGYILGGVGALVVGRGLRSRLWRRSGFSRCRGS